MEKGDLVRLASEAVAARSAAAAAAAAAAAIPLGALAAVTRFDLVASVVHEVTANTESGGPGMGGGGKGRGAGGSAGSSGRGGAGGAAASAATGSSSSAPPPAAPAPAASSADAMLSTAAAAVRSTASASDPLHRGAYKVHLLGPSTASQQLWYEISDLAVTEILAQQVGVSESCALFFARRETEEALASALAEG